jgi:hypothetical protein
MADVTPAGEGPAPLGQGVDRARAGTTSPQPVQPGRPGGPWAEYRPAITGLASSSPPPPVRIFAPGSRVLVATPAGAVDVTVAGGCFLLTADFGPLPAGTAVQFDDAGHVFALLAEPGPGPRALDDAADLLGIAAAGMISSRVMGGFLDKAGPAPPAAAPPPRPAAAPVAVPDAAPAQAAVPGHPGRTGRAIELD